MLYGDCSVASAGLAPPAHAPPPYLGRQHNDLAPAAERAAEEFFADAVTVDIRGSEEGDAEFERASDDPLGLGQVSLVAELDAPQSYGADRQVRLAEASILHSRLLRMYRMPALPAETEAVPLSASRRLVGDDLLQPLAEAFATVVGDKVDVGVMEHRFARLPDPGHDREDHSGRDLGRVGAADARRLVHGDAEAVSHVASPQVGTPDFVYEAPTVLRMS